MITGKIQDGIVAAYLAGATLKEVGAQFGYPIATCHRVLVKRGIPRRKQGRANRPARGYPTQETQDGMVAAYLAGASLRKAGEQFGYSYEACRSALMRRGIPRRAKSKLSPEYIQSACKKIRNERPSLATQP